MSVSFILHLIYRIFVDAMSEEKLKSSARDTFTEYMVAKKLRKTPERYAILDKVFDMTQHFHIDTLSASLEKDAYHVSRATVYNTMELLTDCGLVRCHRFPGQPVQYERVAGVTNHLHAICTQCGKVKEVKDPELVKLLNSRRYSTFHTSYIALYVYGICSACVRKNRRNKKQ